MYKMTERETARSKVTPYPDTLSLKKTFARELLISLQREYGGRLPSIATVARDFSLRAPHLRHISGEAIRKWLSGTSVPHMSRMSVLVEWLGPELREVFERKPVSGKTSKHRITTPYVTSSAVHQEIIDTALKLSQQDAQAALTFLQDLMHTSYEST